MSFESSNWKLSFYKPKFSVLKKRDIFHTALPKDFQNVLKNLPDIETQSFEKSLGSYYFLFFSPTDEKKISKLRYVLRFQYTLPTSGNMIQFSDTLMMLILELQNYATFLSDGSSIEYRSSVVMDSMKANFKSQLKACAIYNFILELLPALDRKAIKDEMPFEFSTEYNTIMRNILLAQAQELGIFFSLDKEKKFKVLAKLGRKAFELYRDSFDLLSKVTCFEKTPPESFLALRGYLITKMIMYDAYSHMQSALYYNMEGENGNAMYLIRDAESMMKKLNKVSSKFTSRHWDKEATKNCNTLIDHLTASSARHSKQFTLENQTVFHARMPESGPDLLESHQLGTVEPWTITKPSNLEGMKDMYVNTFTGADEQYIGEEPPTPVDGASDEVAPPLNPINQSSRQPSDFNSKSQMPELVRPPTAPKDSKLVKDSKGCNIL